MRTFCRLRRRDDEAGFTLVEMMIALFLGAFVFTAIAATLAAGVKATSTQKLRTQANEIATQAIEDLQRLDDEYLGFCTAPASPPVGFSDSVGQPHCPANTVLHDPCQPPAAPAAPANLAPKSAYDCRRVNMTYSVSRFIAWADAAKIDKKLAVRVSWTDQGRPYEVTQQTTRATALPPTIVSGGVAPAAISVDANGNPTSSVVFTAVTTGLKAADTVRVHFLYKTAGNVPAHAAMTLAATNAAGTEWSWTMAPADFKFPLGVQFIYFSAVRSTSDKKEGAGAPVQVSFTCGAPSCPSTGTSPSPAPPTVSYTPIVASAAATPDADSAGALVSATLKVTVNASSSAGMVTALVPTVGGGVRALNLAKEVPTCASGTCAWSATLSRATAGARGYRFSNTGTPTVRVNAGQMVAHGTTNIASSGVAFQ